MVGVKWNKQRERQFR